jgi:uncharacterized protein
MKKAIIVHGSYGSPDENWFPWLKEELEKIGYAVEVPRFPTPENQSLEPWMGVFKDYKIDRDTILIAHSLGPAFILNLLEIGDKRVRACFFVSGFIGLLNNSNFDSINKTFTDKEFNWERIKNNCKKFYLYHSDNDPYVPLAKAKELKEKLGAKLKIIDKAGHFNSESGYIKFEELLKDIKNLK